MRKSSPKTPQTAASLLSNIDSLLGETHTFANLDSFLNEANKKDMLSPSQCTKMQILTNQLFESVCKIVLTQNDSSVFHLLNQSIAKLVISQQNITGPDNKSTKLLSPHVALDGNNDDDDINAVIKNLNEEDTDQEDDVVDRIAEKLQLKTPTTESQLVKAVSSKLIQSETARLDIISTFGLPKNTHMEYIATALSAKFAKYEENEQKQKQLLQIQQGDDSAQNSEAESENGKELESLKQELEHSKSELSIAEKQLEIMRDEVSKKDEIIQQFNEKEPGTQMALMADDANTELVSKKLELAKLKSDFQALKNENNELNKFRTQTQTQFAKIQSAYKELQKQNSALSAELDRVKSELKSNRNRFADSNYSSNGENNINSETDTDRKYKSIRPEDQNTILEDFLDQFEKQSEELTKESSIRVKLISAIQKLQIANQSLEANLSNAENKIEQLQKTNGLLSLAANANNNNNNNNNNFNFNNNENKFKANKNNDNNNNNNIYNNAKKQNKQTVDDISESLSESEEKVDESLIETIKGIIDNIKGEQKVTIMNVCNNTDLTISKRILSVISSLSDTAIRINNSASDAKAVGQREDLLLDTISSLMNFINSTVKSQEVQSWTLSRHTFSDSAKLMTDQIKVIEKFLNGNCVDIKTERTNIFNAFIQKNDPASLEEDIKMFLSDYDDVRTNEGKNLLVLLQQAVAAGFLLEAYTQLAKSQCNVQGNELRSLRQQIADIRHSNEKDCSDIQNELNKTRLELLKLQTNLSNKKGDQNNYNNCNNNNDGDQNDETYSYTSSYTENIVLQRPTLTKQKKQQKSQKQLKETNAQKQPKRQKSPLSENNMSKDANKKRQKSPIMKTNKVICKIVKFEPFELIDENDCNDDLAENDHTDLSCADDKYMVELQKKLEKERKKFNETKERLEKYRKTVRSVKMALRNEFLKGNQSPTILESFNTINNIDKQPKHQALSQHEGGESENHGTEFEFEDDFITELNNKSVKDNEEIMNLHNQMKEKEEIIRRLSVQVDEMKKQKKKAEEDLRETTNVINPQIQELQQKIDETTEDYEKRLYTQRMENENMKILIQKLKQKAITKYSQLQEATKNNINKMKEEHQQQKLELVQQNKKILDSLQNEIHNREEIEQQISVFKRQNEKIKQKFVSLKIEAKMANAKLAGKEEEIKREKTLADSQWQLKQMDWKVTAQTQLDAYKREVDEKSNSFLIAVCNLFKEYYDVKKSMSFDSVFSMLQNISNVLASNDAQMAEIQKIKSFSENKDDSHICQNVIQTFQQNEIMRGQLELLTDENVSIKRQLKAKDRALLTRMTTRDWENWALPYFKKLENGQTNVSQPTAVMLRSVLGDALRQILSQMGEEVKAKRKVERPMLHLSIVMIAVLRLQRLSGNNNRRNLEMDNKLIYRTNPNQNNQNNRNINDFDNPLTCKYSYRNLNEM